MDGRIWDRYEISHTREGLIGTRPTRQEAFEFAQNWFASVTGYDDAESDTTVHDMMARVGQTTAWRRERGRWCDYGKRLA